MTVTVAVLGATGFVGSAVIRALEQRGVDARPVRAPRLPETGLTADFTADDVVQAYADQIDALSLQLAETDTVVNCAGDPDASSQDASALDRANGYLAGVAAAAATRSEAARFIHVSSAVVQGRRETLDDTLEFDGFSAYARSKILGERLALGVRPERTTVYRPPSVHAAGRRVTQMTAKIARSRLSTVAAPGTGPTPQALLTNVADAIAHLATCESQPPPVVIHPWEGLTTSSLLTTFSGRRPTKIPRTIATTVVGALSLASSRAPRLAANARRIEMIWFGQKQATSWLTVDGWTPPTPWKDLAVPD